MQEGVSDVQAEESGWLPGKMFVKEKQSDGFIGKSLVQETNPKAVGLLSDFKYVRVGSQWQRFWTILGVRNSKMGWVSSWFSRATRQVCKKSI